MDVPDYEGLTGSKGQRRKWSKESLTGLADVQVQIHVQANRILSVGYKTATTVQFNSSQPIKVGLNDESSKSLICGRLDQSCYDRQGDALAATTIRDRYADDSAQAVAQGDQGAAAD